MTNGRGKWIVAYPFGSGRGVLGRFSKLGATLSLTDDELRIAPLAGFGRQRTIRLDDVLSVESAGERPPRLTIMSRDGKPITLLVLDRRMRAIWNKRSAARDDALRQITAALVR
jgi:hypothetical protein